MTMKFKSFDDAFDFAIDSGRLSSNPSDSNYAGKFMYMGTKDGVDLFKNIETREYYSTPWTPVAA